MIFSEDRILILDGAMGTLIQRHSLSESDYRGDIFCDCRGELRGNNECLNLNRPDIIKSIHLEYIAAGADIIETNIFSANRISQTEYGCEDFAERMALEGARLGREAALKNIERAIGLKRSEDIAEVDGLEAVRLWKRWTNRGDEESLRRLVEYNRADTINLEVLADTVYPRLVKEYAGFEEYIS